MRESEFLNELGKVKNSYKWTVINGSIQGVALRGDYKGLVFNPITAVVRTTRPTIGKTTTEFAANILKLPNHLVKALCFSKENRGHSQVIKGRVKKALEV